MCGVEPQSLLRGASRIHIIPIGWQSYPIAIGRGQQSVETEHNPRLRHRYFGR